MKEIYYLLLLVITGLGSSLMTMYYPYLKRVIRRYKAKLKRSKPNYQAQIDTYETALVKVARRVAELESQVDNIAKRQSNRESNLKQRTRKMVREYLEELKND